LNIKEKDKDQEKYILEKYSSDHPAPFEDFLKKILKLINDSKAQGIDNESVLMDALDTIQSFTKFKGCTLGLKDPDGLYRFKAMVGFRDEAMAARREIAFTNEDMKDIFSYRPINICRFSQLHISERKPYKPGMENTYNNPEMLDSPRTHPDDMIEGDYVEIVIRGKAQEIIGWLELSGTSDGKLPSRETVLQMEFFSSCLIPILQTMIR